MIQIESPWNIVGVGNVFFMYAYGRQLAEKLNLKLETTPIKFSERNGTHEIQSYKFQDIQGENNSNFEIIEITDSFAVQYENIENVVNLLSEKRYNIILKGYFQKYSYWKKNKKIVKSYFKDFIGNIPYDNSSVAIHLRKSMEDNRFDVPIEYYLDSIEKSECDKIYLFADNFTRHEKFINEVKKNKKYQVTLMDTNVPNSIKQITSFKNIICSQGSFSFWVSFLSDAQQIFWPICDLGPNNAEMNWSIDYNVKDEERYKVVRI